MTEMYGSYSDEDLNEWERMPQNIGVLTSSAFGAWLMRRDKRIKKQEPKTDGDAISRQTAIKNVAQIAKAVAKSDKQKSLCGRIIFMLEHQTSIYRESEG